MLLYKIINSRFLYSTRSIILEKIYSKYNKKNRSQRDKLIKKSVLEFGYSQREVGDHLGLHFTTVSWIMNRNEKN